ncbi:ABC transporter permease [Neolewinella antarctica]|uniref:Peptide/nickel transport system permease protein n=1 Tax=Neolewinella antarctica TaxID=442734 RepID=A0ABX0XBM5_9BACT|nr:ABC transporter permease [Neolewinella antarctica]NJC26338.1 peptide/nickel transport system permease protein [Neolewinella antarctica]
MYALRRLLYLPFSLVLLSLLCFVLSSYVPLDPVASSLPSADSRLSSQDPETYDRIYRRAATRLGYDKPPFYVSISNAALPDTLHRITRPTERKMLRALTLDAGNWEKVAEYYRVLKAVAFTDVNSTSSHDEQATLLARRLLLQDDPEVIRESIDGLRSRGRAHHLTTAHTDIYQNQQRQRLLWPVVRWHGTGNQYHRWLSNIFAGDFGISYLDQQPVIDKIKRAVPNTLLLNALALFIIFALSIPLGLYLARRVGTRRESWITGGLFILYGVPSFWVATLLATFFTTPAYGMDFFPSMGLGSVPVDASWWETVSVRGGHLILPVLCLSYPALAYVSRHLRQSGTQELSMPYVRTARMKGLSERKILWGHVFRNASFPLVTLFGNIIPGMLAGSVLIERIFNIPGMGQLLYVSAVGGDWPVIIMLVMINGLLTALGLLVADLTYAAIDPRVELNRPSLTQVNNR